MQFFVTLFQYTNGVNSSDDNREYKLLTANFKKVLKNYNCKKQTE